jgi:acetyl esterase/lipase
MLLLLAFVMLLCWILWLFLPKGNVAHELLHLPTYWIRMRRAPLPEMTPEHHSYGDHPRQYFLFFKPAPGEENEKPLIVYFHGGGWCFGSPEAFKAHARVFLEAGFPVALPSVRRIPRYRFHHMELDLTALLRYLEGLKKENGWKGRPLVIGGMSSGGHLAAHLAFNSDIQERSRVGASVLAGAFFCGTPLDLDPLSLSPVIRLLAGAPQRPAFRRANSIMHLPPHRKIPMLIIHGAQDGLVPNDSAESFVEKAIAFHAGPVKWHVLPGGTHLDAASWGHTENEVRQVLLEWLEKVEKKRQGKDLQ